ncbi:hypothetical protein BVH03_21855 [Pseudomonas sp. PA15(2017)]|uniref:hypothetical protein n=1 Tax=Pseudomonas sp. PA15(2017) TaxID=1932111 RepID=UPI00096209D8|nr:hypothetical protein [Pseudomonas sp. PA15(2017)]OLU22900.1 hypothetical protein BVH03_21855 [Pseudomonas sp. PA15(2017)]
MSKLSVDYLITTAAGDIQLNAAGLEGAGVSRVRLAVGGETLILSVDGDAAQGQIDTPFVADSTYDIYLEVDGPGGLYSTDLILVAGEAGDYTGYISFAGLGSLTPNTIEIAEQSATGPATEFGLITVLTFFSDQASMPRHPSITYDPMFDPSVDLSWLYHKEPDGTETLNLIRTPNPPGTVTLGPDKMAYYIVADQEEDSVEGYNIEVRLMRAEPAPYGVVPAPAAVFRSYQIQKVPPLSSANIVWNNDGELVFVTTHQEYYSSDADRLVVVKETEALISPFYGLEGSISRSHVGIALIGDTLRLVTMGEEV